MNLQLTLPLQRSPERVVIGRPFGANPEAYRPFGLQGHNGIDFAAEAGELVVAVDEGEVIELRLDPSGYGLTVKLSHPWGESRYAHGRWLTIPIEFELGHAVRQGERIFLVEGDHLHFGLRIRRDDGSLDYSGAGGFGGYEDPLPFLTQALRLPHPPSPATAREGRLKGPHPAPKSRPAARTVR